MALVNRHISTTVIASSRPLQCLKSSLFSLNNLFNEPTLNYSVRGFYDCDMEKKIITFEYNQFRCPLGHVSCNNNNNLVPT